MHVVDGIWREMISRVISDEVITTQIRKYWYTEFEKRTFGRDSFKLSSVLHLNVIFIWEQDESTWKRPPPFSWKASMMRLWFESSKSPAITSTETVRRDGFLRLPIQFMKVSSMSTIFKSSIATNLIFGMVIHRISWSAVFLRTWITIKQCNERPCNIGKIDSLYWIGNPPWTRSLYNE